MLGSLNKLIYICRINDDKLIKMFKLVTILLTTKRTQLMKRTFTSAALLLAMAMAATAQEKNIRVVDCSGSGSETNLSSVLSKERYDIDSLVVIAGSSTLTEKDILFMADCCKKGRLTGIDISRCYYVENNRIPDWAFASDYINGMPRRGEETGGDGENPFRTNLRYITLPNGITEIGACAFTYTNLEAITLPHRVKTVGSGAFANCENLKSVTIRGDEDKSQTIGYVFYGLPSDAVLKVAPGLGDRYRNSDNWEGFTVVESEDAFRVVEAEVGNGQTLAEALGDYNMNVDSLVLGGQPDKDDFDLMRENVRYGRLLGLNLADCLVSEGYLGYRIRTIRMPRQLEKIPLAFLSHVKGDLLILPESYKEICSFAFEYTTGFADSTLVVPEGCRRIGYRAFGLCKGLKRVVLPSSLEVLEESALGFNWNPGSGNNVVAEIYVNRMYPPISSTKREDAESDYEYDDGPFGCQEDSYGGYWCTTNGWTLYVPLGAKKNYESDKFWSHFEEIIETPLLTGEPTGISGTPATEGSRAADGIYTLDGRLVAKDARVDGLPKGLYIVKENGSTRKVLR